MNPACFCHKQKIPPRGVEPLNENQQPLDNKALTENQNPVLSTSLDKILRKYPEFEEIITAWPELTEQERKAILDIVKG